MNIRKIPTILIVEDDVENRAAMVKVLEGAGYKTLETDNGQQALDILKNGGVDIMLLDLMMPELDGFQVLQQIQQMQITPQPIVFVLSNLSQREDEERVLALGAKKFFIKSDTSLSTIVEEVKTA